MPKKMQTKATHGARGASAGAKRETFRAPGFVSLYANDIQVQTSPWDMHLLLGEISSITGTDERVIAIKEIGELRISPQLAKSLTAIMTEQISFYEERFGQIPGPPKQTE